MIPGATTTIDKTLHLPPPVMSNIVVSNISLDSAVITWTTDIPSDSRVDCGTTNIYGQISSDAGLVTSHSITLISLASDTTYHFRATSTNSDGFSTVGTDTTFSTLAMPVISNIVVSNITGNSARITWETDQPADSFVEYGDTTAYGLAAGDTPLSTTHSVDLVGLNSGQTYHFMVTSTNNQGVQAVSSDNIFDTQQMFTVTITEPLDGATLPRPGILVKGTFVSFNGKETGVVVNGVPAMVNGNDFAINNVLLQDGDNTITVTATDVDGNTAETSITVSSQADQKYIRAIPVFESSIAPMETRIRVDGNFAFANVPTLSYSGPGAVEFLTCAEPDTFNVGMTEPGIYYFTADVQDDLGTVYTDTVAVLAMDRAVLDALLSNKWNGMTQALQNGDVTTALEFFVTDAKQIYDEQFTVLAPVLSNIAAEFSVAELVLNDVVTNTARCDLLITREGVDYAFILYFIPVDDGIWKIWRF